MDEEDQKIFLYYLFIYLADPEVVKRSYPKLRPHLVNGNLSSKVKLLCYSLMPNHFHFLLHQTEKENISKLLKQLTNAYTLYFNTKYHRVGPLFQGRFKAVQVDNDNYLLHLTRYIHQNPLKINFVLSALKNYPWSSYPYYLGMEANSFTDKNFVLDYFSTKNPNFTYKNFVENTNDLVVPENLVLEDD